MSRTINLIIALLLALMLVGIALAADDIAEETGKEPVITEEQPIEEIPTEITYTQVPTTITQKPTPTPYPAIIEKERITGKVSTATFNAATVTVDYPAKNIGASHSIQINGEKFIPASTSTDKNTIKWKSSTNPVYDLLDWNDYIVKSEYTDSRIKETIILRKDAELSFPLTLTGKAAILKKENGDIAIYNREDGRWWQGIIIEKPYGIDANGKYIPMEYKIEGSTLNLVYNHAGITYPLTIDPTYKIGGILFNEFKPVKLVSPTTTYTKIPVEFTIWNATGTNTSTTLYVQNKVKIDFSDIRFASEDMTTLLKYNKTVYNLSVAKFLVEVPQVTASPGTIVNVFYGNNTATSNSTALSGISGAKYLGVNAVYSTDTERFPFNLALGAYNPNTTTAYSDAFTTNTETRYSQWKQIIPNSWLKPTTTEVVVSGGRLNLNTANGNRILAVLKSYRFKSGLLKADFIDKSTGTGSWSNGIVFGFQGNQSYYICNVSDTLSGSKNISIYRMNAGTLSQIGTTYRVNKGYLTRNNLTTIEVYFDSERGIITGYVYNATSWPKNTTADTTATGKPVFQDGKFGVRSYVRTAGGLNVDWDAFEVKANSLVGYTNVVKSESNFFWNGTTFATRYYFEPILRGAGIGKFSTGSATVNATRFTDDFNSNSIAEYTQVYRTWTINPDLGEITASGSNALIHVTRVKFGTGLYQNTWYTTSVAASYTNVLVFAWDGTSNGAGVYYNCYRAAHVADSGAFNIYYYDGTGTSHLIASGTAYPGVANTQYRMVATWDRTTGAIWAGMYSMSGILLTSASGTDTSIQTPGYFGFRSSATQVHITSASVIALESTSTNGVAYALGGVSHGARYDTNEYAGITFPNTVSGYYQSYLPSKITNTSFTNLGLNQYFVSAINQAGTSISNISAAPRKLNVGHGQLNFDNESISINPTTTQANVFTNWSKWSGVEYDWRPTTVFTYPIVAPSIYAFSMPVGAGLANFTTNRNLGVIGTPTANVTFTDASIADPAYPVNAWLWNFNDGGAGNTSTLQNPEYRFVTSGLHTVSLTITTTSGTTDSFTRGIMMDKVNFTAAPINGSAQLPVTFTTSTTNLTNVKSSWYYFGDGAANKTAALNTTHTYLWDGQYKIWHNVTYVNNQIGNSTHNVTVWGVPSISKTASYGYRPKSIRFFDNSTASEKGTTAGKDWYWNFGDGNTSTSRFPVHVYSFNGTFPVTLNVHYAPTGHWANTSTSVTIYSLLASYTTNQTTGYRPLNVAFNDTSYENPLDPITSWAWIFGDGNSTTKTSPLNKNESHKYVFSGSMLTSLTTTTSGGTSSVFAKYLTVYPAGYVDHDILMSANYSLGLDIRDASTHALITETVTVETTGTVAAVKTTDSGHTTISSPYGLITASASAPGYYSETDAWLMDRNRNETRYLTQSQDTGNPVWYSPHIVRLVAVNEFGTPITGLLVNATYTGSSLQSTDQLNQLFGISTIAQPLLINGTVNASAITSVDGAVSFTLHQNLRYTLTFKNATEGISYIIKEFAPKEDEYRIWITTQSAVEDIYGVVNASLTFSEPSATTMKLGVLYADTSGKSQQLTFYLNCSDNNTRVSQHSMPVSSSGAIMAYNVTIPHVHGQGWYWGFDTSRTGSENVSAYQGVTARSILVNILPTGYEKYYPWIAFILLALIASTASKRNLRFIAILLPVMAAVFWYWNWYTAPYFVPLIPALGVLGAMYYMRGSLKENFGYGGAGSMIVSIVFYLVCLQLVVGFINGIGVFQGNAAFTPSNGYINVDFTDIDTNLKNVGGVSNPLTDAYTWANIGWTTVRIILDMVIGVLAVSLILGEMFPFLPPTFILLIQVGIYVLYALFMFQIIYRPNIGQGEL